MNGHQLLWSVKVILRARQLFGCAHRPKGIELCSAGRSDNLNASSTFNPTAHPNKNQGGDNHVPLHLGHLMCPHWLVNASLQYQLLRVRECDLAHS